MYVCMCAYIDTKKIDFNLCIHTYVYARPLRLHTYIHTQTCWNFFESDGHDIPDSSMEIEDGLLLLDTRVIMSVQEYFILNMLHSMYVCMYVCMPSGGIGRIPVKKEFAMRPHGFRMSDPFL